MAAKTTTAHLSAASPANLASLLKAGGADKSASSIISVVGVQAIPRSAHNDGYYTVYGLPSVQPGPLTYQSPMAYRIDNRNHGEPHEQGSPQTKKAAGEKKEKAKKSKEPRQAPRTVINTTGATFGTVSGGTVHANTTTARGSLNNQYGPKSQQRWANKGEKMDSESEEDSDTSDDSSD